MGVSLAFGVLFATLITLVMVPCLYLVLDDVVRFARWLYGNQKKSEPAVATEEDAPPPLPSRN